MRSSHRVPRIASAIAAVGIVVAGPVSAAPAKVGVTVDVPGWAGGALRFAVANGYLAKKDFRPNQPMARATFSTIMREAFGGGYAKTKGSVTAGEVDATLVRALGKQEIARLLLAARSPDGWDPGVTGRFGTEIVAREMGLRHDRPTSEEHLDASAREPMTQADVLYAVWKAKTSPSTWGADELASFSLGNYGPSQRKVIAFAFSQVGSPYVWGGEWATTTPAGYPYGAQSSGGFDCSGFSWFVLRQSSSSWSPPGRDYRGWALPERSSSDMARAVPRAQRLGFKELQPADLLLFAPNGRRSKASTVYHAGVYLGRGWMIDSSGSQAGVSLSYIGSGSWWHDQFAWGRRVIR
jgi:cell wall-associated NlpC family hydrolase